MTNRWQEIPAVFRRLLVTVAARRLVPCGGRETVDQ